MTAQPSTLDLPFGVRRVHELRRGYCVSVDRDEPFGEPALSQCLRATCALRGKVVPPGNYSIADAKMLAATGLVTTGTGLARAPRACVLFVHEFAVEVQVAEVEEALAVAMIQGTGETWEALRPFASGGQLDGVKLPGIGLVLFDVVQARNPRYSQLVEAVPVEVVPVLAAREQPGPLPGRRALGWGLDIPVADAEEEAFHFLERMNKRRRGTDERLGVDVETIRAEDLSDAEFAKLSKLVGLSD